MKKILIVLGAVLLALIAGAIIFLGVIKNRALPDYNSDIRIDGLSADVTVYRDSFAIPHIYAENERDLYLAVGYAMAQDRLWQMDLLRRVTLGRLAEILGPELVDADVLFRALRFSEKSRRVLATADAGMMDCIQAFADGVNQYIAAAGKKLPPEFAVLGYRPEKWLPEHSLNLIGYMAWDLSTGWPYELLLDQLTRRLGPELAGYMVPDMDSVHKSVIYDTFRYEAADCLALQSLAETVSVIDKLGLDVFRGSNNWAVAGKKSTTGMPLLANDMHLGLNIPGIWYQMHQVIPGKLNVTGVVLPGQPMIIAGHNDSIAWGFTNVMTDDADFYLETVNPNNPDQYRFNGAWKDFRRVTEKIMIKGGDSVIRINRFTHRGPVISEIKGISNRVLSMRWLGNEESNEVLSVYKLNRAANWTQFRDALRTFVSVNQNAVYADVQGNIGLQSTIGIPVREGDRTLVSPGDTSRYDWKGLVPFDELPVTFNPECGYVSSANCKTAPPDYSYYISDWYVLPYRMDRIRQMLNEKDKLSTDDFKRMLGDHRSTMAEKFTGRFLAAFNGQVEPEGDAKTLLANMRSWDFTLDAGKPEAVIFEKWYLNTGLNIVKDQMDSILLERFVDEKSFFQNFMENIVVKPSTAWSDDLATPDRIESLDDIIQLSFNQTVEELIAAYGKDSETWKWGNVHSLTLEHPLSAVKILDRVFGLNRGPYPVGGSFHTVSPYAAPLRDPAGVNHGASERHIFDTGDWDRSLTVIPTGTSGIPASKHYCDQSELYVTNRFHSDYVTRKKVESCAKYRMSFLK